MALRTAPSRLLLATAVASAVACGGNSPSTPTPSPTPTPTPPACAFTVGDGPASAIAAGGAEFTVSITTAATCAWSAASGAPFITTVGASTGSGDGSVRFAVQPNSSSARQGTVQVATRTLTVNQDAAPPEPTPPPPGPCAFTVSPTSFVASSEPTTQTFAITQTSGEATCKWAVQPQNSFIQVFGNGSGTGSGTSGVIVERNFGAARTGTVIVAGHTVTVTQQAGGGGNPIAVLAFTSDPGDYIGQGQSQSYSLGAGQYQATLNGARSELRFTTPFGGPGWNLSLHTAGGVTLAPGLYSPAYRATGAISPHPGIDFSGNGRGCNVVNGRFLVATASFTALGEIQRFHARFEQHCEGWSAALRGTIWIDANGAMPPAIAAFPSVPSTPTTLFSYASDPGDVVGNGQSRTFTLTGMKFLARQVPDRRGVEISMESTSGPLTFWLIMFGAASGPALQPGTYAGATRYPFNSGVPGLSVTGGTGCNTVTGSFVVHEAVYGPTGEVQRFHATFEQHCNGATPALRGEVRIVADPWR